MERQPAVDTHKILMYYGAWSPSQIIFSGMLADVLIDEGHIVDKIVMEHNPLTTNGSTQLRNCYRIKYPRLEDNPFMRATHLNKPFQRHEFLSKEFKEASYKLCRFLINDQTLMEKLRTERYDLLITGIYEGCPFGLLHLLEIPAVVGITATPIAPVTTEALGLPSVPTYIYDSPLDDEVPEQKDGKLTLWQRAQSLKSMIKRNIGWEEFRFYEAEQQVFDDLFGPIFPRLKSLYLRQSFIFVNTNELIDLIRPISPKIQYIGGIGLVTKERKAEAENLKNYSMEIEEAFQRGKKGVVVLSFGSCLKTLQIPPKYMLEILESFVEDFPEYSFLWRFEVDAYEQGYRATWLNETSMAERPEMERTLTNIDQYLSKRTNVYRISWLPQRQLLKDPRVRVFITHVGMNSYIELSEAGMPVVAIPIFADQFYNTGCIIGKSQIGVYIPKSMITRKRLTNALSEVLNDPSYTQKAHRLAEMFYGEPEKAKQRFIELVDRAARFPELSDAYQLNSVKLSTMEQYNLDLLATMIAALLLAGFTIFTLIRWLIRRLIWQQPGSIMKESNHLNGSINGKNKLH